jgi:hypothetical protein
MTPDPIAVPAYVGNGPYCFTNSLVMMLGETAPPIHLVETLTGSPFGCQLLAGQIPLFDPYGWNPDLGLDQALDLLDLKARRTTHRDETSALEALRQELTRGPVLVGPVDMGLLAHQPGSDRASGADHFVVVTGADQRDVSFHDPQGHPYAVLPTAVFLDAWRADGIGYLQGESYAMRTGIERTRAVSPEQALTRLVPLAGDWAAGRSELPVPPGTIGGAEAYARLAEVLQEPAAETLDLLAEFGIRVGARRRGDAARCLRSVGYDAIAACLETQAVTLGGLQYAAVTGDGHTLAHGCLRLAEQHVELLSLLH